MDRAGAEHHATGANVDALPADAGPNAGGAARFDEHLVHKRRAEDPQVCALACRLQVRIVGGDPGTVARVEAERRHAGGGGSVVVLAPAVSEPEGRFGERVVGRPPLVAGHPLDRDRTVHTVVGPVAEVGVALHPPQVGQHVGVRPPRAAERRPAVVVVRNGTEGHHAVDRRRAAKAPAAQVRPRLLDAGAARLEALPLERRARRLVERPPAVDAAQLHGGLARTPVRPGLQQHDLLGRVFAQATGEHAPGAATTDDQPVRFDRPRHHPPTFIHTLLICVSSSSDAAPERPCRGPTA